MKRTLFLLLPFVALLIGCLSDNVNEPQIVARLIYPPGKVFYRCVAPSNLEIRWNPSPSDTQNNFKGYFVELYRSNPYFKPSSDGVDSVFSLPIDSVHVPKTDTTNKFANILPGRYTARIYGEHDHLKPDTLILSESFSAVSFDYDPQPVLAPPLLLASSAGSTSVRLSWPHSLSESQIGMYGYVVRYIDTLKTGASLIFSEKVIVSTTIQGNYSTVINVPGNGVTPQEKVYKFWVKAIRKDSVESSDSIGIVWSGAERLPTSQLLVRLDTGIFIGAAGLFYNLVQVEAGSVNADFVISHTGSTMLIQGKNGTQFVNRVDRDSALTLDNNYFKAPFDDGDFNQAQVSFPDKGITNEGAMFYALLPGKARARVWIPADSGGFYIRTGNTLQIQSSFQPIEPLQLKFF